MTRGFVPERDEAGNENWDVMRIDLDLEVPQGVLEGRDVVDFLLRNGVDVGTHDAQVAARVAEDLDLPTVVTLLSWVRRAAEANEDVRRSTP